MVLHGGLLGGVRLGVGPLGAAFFGGEALGVFGDDGHCVYWALLCILKNIVVVVYLGCGVLY